MATRFKFDWGEAVRVRSNAPAKARPGQMGSIAGMRELKAERLYMVEFSDGQAIEIVENLIEPINDK